MSDRKMWSWTWHPEGDEIPFKAMVVHLISCQKTEEALDLLGKHYHVSPPKLKVGMPKRDIKHKGCYVVKNKTIHVANSDYFYNSYIILHEFYHHLRTTGTQHKGTEKNADKFAQEFMFAYHAYVLSRF